MAEDLADHSQGKRRKLDLSTLPPIFVSATHFQTEDLHQLEEDLIDARASLTYDIHEARIVLSKVKKKARIQFDLRSKGLWTEDAQNQPVSIAQLDDSSSSTAHHVSKKQKLEANEAETIVVDDSSTASETEDASRKRSNRSTEARKGKKVVAPSNSGAPAEILPDSNSIKVIAVEWFARSLDAGVPLPIEDYLSYDGRVIERPIELSTPKQPSPARTKVVASKKASPSSKDILERAKEDAPSPSGTRIDRFGKRKFGVNSKSTTGASWEAGHGSSSSTKTAHLIHATTSEHDTGSSSDLPELPDWVKQRAKYACERASPRTNPNETFIGLLKKIKTARLLTNDEIGVRAYSTSIASLCAYPYKLTSPREVVALPGCEGKIANLFVEWMNTGQIQAVEDLEANEELKVLKLFYEIWGVGALTAREFYYERGWQDLNDIVEFGWSTLSRVQQIGVKYYDEFLDLIPRAEVEEIGRIVHQHAVKVRDDRIQSVIVGGHRRGKEASGDVDMIISHPDETQTADIVNDVVSSLEEDGWITHTLLLSLNSTHRGQQTLPFRSGATGGHGFDSLDKALVVWQDPNWATKDADLANDPNAKNPNIHRRVDIIIASWHNVGCAVAGWTSGTTFQRDLRRYAKNVKGWKFDSSGVRSRINGEVVDVEGYYDYHGKIGTGRAKTMEEAEKRVFEGFGLTYREPWDRCTG